MKRNLSCLNKNLSQPLLGCGVGLRHDHYQHIMQAWPDSIDWFEAITENYMDSGGKPIQILEKIRERYPVALHGVSLSIGSIDPINQNYLARLKVLAERIEPAIISDHLCWSRVDGDELHDLLPLPFTAEALNHVVSRVQQVQDFLGRKILLENVSAYITYRHSEMTEWEFIRKVAERSGCDILLDLNNVYVNSVNHSFDPYEYVQSIPGSRVGQIHLSGHTDMGSFLFDTHDHEIIDAVWGLYRHALSQWGAKTTLIEWDANIPPFEKLIEEVEKARVIYKNFNDVTHPHGEQEDAPKHPMPEAAIPGQPSLDTVQRWFKTKMKPYSGKSTLMPNDINDENLLNLQNGIPGIERIAVYADGYKARIEEALSEVYAAVRHILGHTRFHSLVDQYAEQHPSRHYNLSSAGKCFPGFVERHPISQTFPFLHDLARLELLIHQAFHAYDKPSIQGDRFRDFQPDDWSLIKLAFQPSIGLIASEWPLLDLWKARHTPVENIHMDLVGRSQKVLVARDEAQVICELLSDTQFFLMEKLLLGKNLEDAFAELDNHLQDEGEEGLVQVWFSQWIQRRFITEVKV